MKNKRLAILVPSWDGASELWKLFSCCISKYWTDCAYDIYLVSSSVKAPENLIFKETILFKSDNRDPVSRMIYALEQIDYSYILLICDDYFCYKTMTNQTIEAYVQYMDDNGVDFINLEKSMGKPQMIQKDMSGMFAVSTGLPCIFKKEMLLDLCHKTNAHSMREFEVRASEYISNHKDIYSLYICKNSNVMFMHGVLEGYWRFEAYMFMKKNDFPMVFKTYKKFSIIHSIRAVCKAIVFNIVLHIFPFALRRYYKNSDSWICKY